MKKIWFILGLMTMLILMSGLVSAEWCYQETANESTACGGLDTGTYSSTGNGTSSGLFSPLFPDSNAYDAIDNTYAVSHAGTATIYINYTIPENIYGANWKIISFSGTQNKSIPQNCFTSSNLELKAESELNYPTAHSQWSCYTGTTWNIIYTDEIGSYDYNYAKIYEEGIYWDSHRPTILNLTEDNASLNGLFWGGYTYPWYDWDNDGFANGNFQPQLIDLNNNNINDLLFTDKTGVIAGYSWNGTIWLENTSITTGLTDIGTYGSMVIRDFDNDGYIELIHTEKECDTYNGYKWIENQWVSYNSIVDGLIDTGQYCKPGIAVIDNIGTTILLMGEADAQMSAYKWNGTSWNIDYTSGYTDGISLSAGSDVQGIDIDGDGIDAILVGNYDGELNGYLWNGSEWVQNVSIINYEISEYAFFSSPTIGDFNNDGQMNLIVGANMEFTGYAQPFYNFEIENIAPEINTSTISNILNPEFGNINIQGNCKGTDEDNYYLAYEWQWYINDIANETGTTNQTNIRNTLININNLSNTITSHDDEIIFSCRAYDGYTYTAWTNSTSVSIIDSIIQFQSTEKETNNTLTNVTYHPRYDVTDATTHDLDSFSNDDYAWDGNSSTYAEKIQLNSANDFTWEFGKTFPNSSVSTVYYDVYTGSNAMDSSDYHDLYLQIYDGTTWTTHTSIKHYSHTTEPYNSLERLNGTITINDNIQGIRLLQATDGYTTTSDHYFYIYELDFEYTQLNETYNTTEYLEAGNYNITAIKENYHSLEKTFTITEGDEKTLLFDDMYTTQFTFDIQNPFDNSTINDTTYNITYNGEEIYSGTYTTPLSTTLNLTEGITYTIQMSKEGYDNTNQTFNVSGLTNDQTFYLNQTALWLSFSTSTNVTVTATNYSESFTGTTQLIKMSAFAIGKVAIEWGTHGQVMEFYNNGSSLKTEIFVESEALDTYRTFKAIADGEVLEGARITAELWETESFGIIYGKLTKSSGEATLALTEGKVYRITIQKAGYTPQTFIYTVTPGDDEVTNTELTSGAYNREDTFASTCGNLVYTNETCYIYLVCETETCGLDYTYTIYYNDSSSTETTGNFITSTYDDFSFQPTENMTHITVNATWNTITRNENLYITIDLSKDMTDPITQDLIKGNAKIWIIAIIIFSIIIAGIFETKVMKGSGVMAAAIWIAIWGVFIPILFILVVLLIMAKIALPNWRKMQN